MEFLFLLNTTKRYFLVSFLISTLIALGAGWYWNTKVQPDYKATLFLSVVTKVDDKRVNDRFDPLSYVESADRFAEGMLGWFRNPDFFKKIQTAVPDAQSLRLDKIYQIRKQEKQNLNITFQVASFELAEKLQKATMDYLRTQVQNINTQSNTTFDIINDTVTITAVKYNVLLVAGVVGASVLLLLILFFLLLEIVRGIVSVKEQVEEIFGKEAIDIISSPKANLVYIAQHIQSVRHPSAIGFVGFSYKKSTQIFKLLVQKFAELTNNSVTLVDCALQSRNLGKIFGLSEHMKKMKGLTDLDEEQFVGSRMLLPLSKELSHIRFLAAGTGTIPQYDILFSHLGEEKVMFFAHFPEAAHVLQLAQSHFVLFIKLGKAKIQDLKRIKHLLGDASFIEFVIVE